MRPSVQSTCLLFVSIAPFWLRYKKIQIGPWSPIAQIQFEIEISRSKVKVKAKGTSVSVASSLLISFLFHINWVNHSYDMANRMFDWGKRIWNFTKNNRQNNSDTVPPKFNQVECMTRKIYLPSFVAIGWAVLTLSWGQGKICTASVAWWHWPKVTEMGTKNLLTPIG